QAGCFVPAKKAQLSVCDRLFARVGACDDILQGSSTFMVEMQETAHILSHATGDSLVLLDEIGRGTSTFDGLSIAWAVTEYLHEHVGARVLFATHYHELTALAEKLTRLHNAHVAVAEEGDAIRFLYCLQDGCAHKSYGIHVARLARLPQEVIRRAQQVLTDLENRQRLLHEQAREGQIQHELFSAQESSKKRQENHLDCCHGQWKDLLAQLLAVDVDRTTPICGLQTLSQLQRLARRLQDQMDAGRLKNGSSQDQAGQAMGTR
ncbi:MAG: hypothetical protein AAF320_03230, partial [Myxococcota bacterium]